MSAQLTLDATQDRAAEPATPLLELRAPRIVDEQWDRR
jgi:hypothetical protein